MRFALTMSLLLNISCATTKPPRDEAKQKAVPATFYTLKEGDRIENKMPLPNRTQIMVHWTNTDGGTKAQEGFRGWDIDHDGRFDMLEVLDKSGKPNMWAFDFDGDGVIDAIETDKAEDMKKLSNLPKDEPAATLPAPSSTAPASLPSESLAIPGAH